VGLANQKATRIQNGLRTIREHTGGEYSLAFIESMDVDEVKYSFHRLLIDHGRAYCTARNPDCDNPVCRDFCRCAFCQ
jgi:endonuclease-3